MELRYLTKFVKNLTFIFLKILSSENFVWVPITGFSNKEFGFLPNTFFLLKFSSGISIIQFEFLICLFFSTFIYFLSSLNSE